MKNKTILAMIVFCILGSAITFSQERSDLSAKIGNLIESGSVKTVTVVLPAGAILNFAFKKLIAFRDVADFRLTSDTTIELKIDSYTASIDLEKIGVYMFDANSKLLVLMLT